MIRVISQGNVYDRGTRKVVMVPTDEAMLVADVIPSGWDLDDPWVHAYVGGARVHGGSVEPGQDVVIYRAPGFQAVAAWTWFEMLLFSLAVSAASAIIQKHLMPDYEDPVVEDKETESYRGFRNSYFPGGSIPLVFGLRRFAPPVVAQAVESNFGEWQLGPSERMKLLLCLGHGPIEGLGDLTGVASTAEELAAIKASNGIVVDDNEAIGLKINGQPSTNFTDVFSFWRTGEITQEPIVGLGGIVDFDTSTTSVIEQEVKEYSSFIDISELAFPSGTYSGGNDIDSGLGESISYTMTDEADRFAMNIFFPKGIFKDAGAGGTTATSAQFRLQYWPVDAVGTRTGNTVLLPEWAVTGDSVTPQSITLTGAFFSPDSFVGAQILGYLQTGTGTGTSATVTAPLNPATIPQAPVPSLGAAFSATAWVRPLGSDGQDYGSIAYWPILSNIDGTVSFGSSIPPYPQFPTPSVGGSGTGVVFVLVARTRKENPDITGPTAPTFDPPITKWSLELHAWQNGGVSKRWAVGVSNPVGEWHQVGVTYNPVSGFATFFIDGFATSATAGGAQGPLFTTEGDLRVGSNMSRLDIGAVALTQGIKQGSFFLGDFLHSGAKATTFSEDTPGLVFGSYLSETIAANQIENIAFPGSTTSGEVIDVVGSGLQAAPQADAPAWIPESGVPLRGRYHMELYRVNEVKEDSLDEVNVSEWEDVTLILDQDFEHPGIAKLAISIDADDQVTNSRPDVSVLVKGVKVPVWANADADYPVFTNTWTRNPAWIALYILTEEEVGLGGIWDRHKDIDLTAWKAWADYCDEGVEDAAGTPAFFNGTPVAASSDHPNGEVHFKIGLLDNLGVSTGETIPETWVVGHTVRIKTASDSSWTVASTDDSVRLAITDIRYEYDSAAPLGYQHWVQIECDWTDAYNLPTASNVTGTAVGFEARHECDLILDSKTDDGWDSVLQVMRSSRAAPILLGNKVSVWVDRARDRDFLITQAQMVEGSYSKRWESNEDRYNGIEFEYVDRNMDYEIQTWIDHHPSVSGEVDPRVIRVAPPQLLRGVTRISEVRRQAVFRLNQMHLLREVHSFQLGPDGLGLAPGDRIGVSHDLAEVGLSGRVYEDVGTATEIKLDRDVEVAAGNTYFIEVRSSAQLSQDGTELRETVQLDASMIPGSGTSTLAAGSTITLSAGFSSITPMQGDVYSFGEATSEDATVVRVTLDPKTMIRTVDAAEYNAGVYLDNEWGDLPDDPGTELPQPPGQTGVGGGIKRPGDNLGSIGGGVTPGVRERSYADISGKPRAAVTVTWPRDDSALGGTNIYVGSLSDGVTPLPKKVGHAPPGATSYEVEDAHFRQGEKLRFFVQHLSASGAGRSARACPWADLTVGGRILAPTAPTITTPKSRNQQAVYNVTFPEGRVPEGIEVRAGGWILGQKVAAALRDGDLAGEWVYGADNSESHGAITHQVRSLLPSGQVSDSATFTSFQSEPLGMTELDATAHEDAWASGTLDSLQVDSSTSPPFLKFSGSDLEGTFETPTVDMAVAKRYYVEVTVEAEQVHPTEAADLPYPASHRLLQSWLGEGPTGGEDVQLSRIAVEWTPSDTGTPTPSWTSLRPGIEHFRSAKFRVRVTRPDSTFDCRIKRFGVRILSVADFEPGDIDGGTW